MTKIYQLITKISKKKSKVCANISEIDKKLQNLF